MRWGKLKSHMYCQGNAIKIQVCTNITASPPPFTLPVHYMLTAEYSIYTYTRYFGPTSFIITLIILYIYKDVLDRLVNVNKDEDEGVGG
jgi:hypothetical protein